MSGPVHKMMVCEEVPHIPSLEEVVVHNYVQEVEDLAVEAVEGARFRTEEEVVGD